MMSSATSGFRIQFGTCLPEVLTGSTGTRLPVHTTTLFYGPDARHARFITSSSYNLNAVNTFMRFEINFLRNWSSCTQDLVIRSVFEQIKQKGCAGMRDYGILLFMDSWYNAVTSTCCQAGFTQAFFCDVMRDVAQSAPPQSDAHSQNTIHGRSQRSNDALLMYLKDQCEGVRQHGIRVTNLQATLEPFVQLCCKG